ncbi:MAG: beta-lactamase family protein [Nitrosospira sp.]|nr:beta-lactamase family protein [Nitrosospira sp.]
MLNIQKRRFLIHIFFLCLLFATTYVAQSKEADTSKAPRSINELQQELEKILKDTRTPGLSVAIMHRDGPEWIAGLGRADVSDNRPATADTLFRIGSVSKAFVSLSILKLVNEKKLSLTDSVHELVPEVWFENQWEAGDPVRVVDLLEHTTGWEDLHLHEYAKDNLKFDLREELYYGRRSRISRWPPGTRMAYSNSGSAVAAYIVQKLTGQRFEDFVAQNFFSPIGMKTATYFPPASATLTSLYHLDGKTPYPYWNILYRPAGAINASAKDMAAYLSFYLHRGTVNGMQVMPAASIDRMEVPTRTWAAQEGLKDGYGLGSYSSIQDGFVYHGHAGGVQGGLTEMAYLPNFSVGYFYSINTDNGDAAIKIGNAIRAYITRELQKPPLPTVASLPANASSYAGWYISDSPRAKTAYFAERLMSMTHVSVDDGRLLLTSLTGPDLAFVPVAGTQFRQLSDPVATAKLLTPNGEGEFIQLYGGMMTMKRIPTWIAITQIVLAAWIALALISVLIYAPFWLLGCIRKNFFQPTERVILGFPLLAVLSAVITVAIVLLVEGNANALSLLGNLTIWSGGIFLATVVFAIASITSGLVLWYTPKQATRRAVRWYSTSVIWAMLVSTAYLAYWGIIGLRTWT